MMIQTNSVQQQEPNSKFDSGNNLDSQNMPESNLENQTRAGQKKLIEIQPQYSHISDFSDTSQILQDKEKLMIKKNQMFMSLNQGLTPLSQSERKLIPTQTEKQSKFGHNQIQSVKKSQSHSHGVESDRSGSMQTNGQETSEHNIHNLNDGSTIQENSSRDQSSAFQKGTGEQEKSKDELRDLEEEILSFDAKGDDDCNTDRALLSQRATEMTVKTVKKRVSPNIDVDSQEGKYIQEI